MKALLVLFAAIALIGSALGEDRKAHPPVLVGAQAVKPPAAPAIATITPPEARAMRAKFPGVPAKNIDTLAFINFVVNRMITYVSDQEHYGDPERWVMMPPDNKGDCEDYALTKLRLLGDAGFPVLTSARLRSVLVGTSGHAILELRMPETGEVVFMDNDGSETLWRRADLVAKGYKFFDW